MSGDLDQTYAEEQRRYQGAFFTPKIWVDEAHLEVEKNLGATWKDDCLVWDCCAGSGNLTRGHTFKDLILSTLVDDEVSILQAEQGASATVFKFDFLNGGITELPTAVISKLTAAVASKTRVVFFMNPPYGAATDKQGNTKDKIADTRVKADMKAEGLGKASANLYAQFLYQVDLICRHFGIQLRSVCVYAPISYLSSQSYKQLRAMWYSRWEFCSGYMLQASNFPSCSKEWAITFIVWREGRTSATALTLDVCELQEDYSSSTSPLSSSSTSAAS